MENLENAESKDEQILRLTQENDELLEMLKKSTVRIQDLNAEVSLYRRATGQDTSNEKKYKQRIAELEHCVSLLSTEFFSEKKEEMGSYLKSIISLRRELRQLKGEENNEESLSRFEERLNSCSEKVTIRFIQLLQSLKTLELLKTPQESGSPDRDDFFLDLTLSLGVVQEILAYKTKEILKLREEALRYKEV